MATFTLAANPIDWDADNNASLSDQMSASRLDLYKKLLEEKVHPFSKTGVAIEARVNRVNCFENPFENLFKNSTTEDLFEDPTEDPTTEVIFYLQEGELVLDESECDINQIAQDEIDYVKQIVKEWFELCGKDKSQELKIPDRFDF
jgi:hypothetical protein